MGNATNIIFSMVCGGLAFRSVGRTHEWLKPENLTKRPLILSQNAVIPILVTIGFWITLGSAALIGWCYSGWPGIFIRPIVVVLASLLIDLGIERLFPLHIRYRFPLNPIVHLFVFPYLFLLGAIIIALWLR